MCITWSTRNSSAGWRDSSIPANAPCCAAGAKASRRNRCACRPAGEIAQTRHPAALGAPLTNEHITTDFSEALIELVTPPFGETWELLQYLCDIHQFVYRHLGDELLWSTSMPCAIRGDASIPLAQFGSSNVGRMKTVYRHGLGVRYGRIMQAISGVHFNYSFSGTLWDALEDINQSDRPRQDFVSEQYFGVLQKLSALRVAGAVPIRQLARGIEELLCGARNRSAVARRDTVYEPYGPRCA